MDFSEKLLTLRKAKDMTQEQMLLREQRQQKIRGCILYGIVVYLILLAVCFVEHNFFWEWDIWSPSIFMAEFLTATAIVVFVCARKFRSEKQ